MKQTCKLSVFLTILVMTSCYGFLIGQQCHVTANAWKHCIEHILWKFTYYSGYIVKKTKQKRTSCVASGGCGKGGCGW